MLKENRKNTRYVPILLILSLIVSMLPIFSFADNEQEEKDNIFRCETNILKDSTINVNGKGISKDNAFQEKVNGDILITYNLADDESVIFSGDREFTFNGDIKRQGSEFVNTLQTGKFVITGLNDNLTLKANIIKNRKKEVIEKKRPVINTNKPLKTSPKKAGRNTNIVITKAYIGTGHPSSTYGNSAFKLKWNNKEYQGICANVDKTPPKAGDTYSNVKGVGGTLRKVAYYGYLHRDKEHIAHWMASYLQIKRPTPASRGIQREYDHMLKLNPPANFKAYYGYGKSGYQDILFYSLSQSPPEIGHIKLIKSASSDKNILKECKRLYSLQGAEYGVYKNKIDDSHLTGKVGIIKTDKNGVGKLNNIKPGTYYIMELKAPAGYENAGSKSMKAIKVSTGQTVTVKMTDKAILDPLNLVLEKREKTDKVKADLSGAIFEIKYYATLGDIKGLKPTRKWVMKTVKIKNKNKVKFVCDTRIPESFVKEKSDAFYKNEQGEIVIPNGIVTIEEIKAPDGYIIDKTIRKVIFDKSRKKGHIIKVENPPVIFNQKFHSNIESKAYDSKTLQSIGCAKKEVTLKDDIIYSGFKSGKTIFKTVLMDAEAGKPLLDKNGEKIIFTNVLYIPKSNDPNYSTKGASGIYTVSKTLSSDIVKGKRIVFFETAIDSDGNIIARHENIDDKDQTIIYPNLKSRAKILKTIGKGKNMKLLLSDELSYENLPIKNGKTKTIKTMLIDKETLKPLLINGKKEIETSFAPKNGEDKTNINIEIMAKDIIGKDVVFFEKIEQDGVIIARHENINDKDQTISVGEFDIGKKYNGYPETGDKNNVLSLIFILLISVAAILVIDYKIDGENFKE